MILPNHIRGYAYLFKVLRGQQGDLFCGTCKAFVNTAAAARMDLAAAPWRERAVRVARLRKLEDLETYAAALG